MHGLPNLKMCIYLFIIRQFISNKVKPYSLVVTYRLFPPSVAYRHDIDSNCLRNYATLQEQRISSQSILLSYWTACTRQWLVSSGTHWVADCGAVAPVARYRCCWWRQGMPAAERLAVVAVAAVYLEPVPGQWWVLYPHLWGELREALQQPRRLRGVLPRRCTTSPTPEPRSLPVLVDVWVRPVDRQTVTHLHRSANQSIKLGLISNLMHRILIYSHIIHLLTLRWLMSYIYIYIYIYIWSTHSWCF